MSKVSRVKRDKVIVRHTEKYGYKCYYCGTSLHQSQSTIEHILPSSKGGTNELENLVLACSRCNGTKSDNSIEWLRVSESLKKSKYLGVISTKQAVELVRLGVTLELPATIFHFETK